MPVLEPLFNKIAGLKFCNSKKKTLKQVFPHQKCEILKNSFLKGTSPVAPSGVSISWSLAWSCPAPRSWSQFVFDGPGP